MSAAATPPEGTPCFEKDNVLLLAPQKDVGAHLTVTRRALRLPICLGARSALQPRIAWLVFGFFVSGRRPARSWRLAPAGGAGLLFGGFGRRRLGWRRDWRRLDRRLLLGTLRAGGCLAAPALAAAGLLRPTDYLGGPVTPGQGVLYRGSL